VILIAICFADLISTVQMLKSGNFKESNLFYFFFISQGGISGFIIGKALLNFSCISMIVASKNFVAEDKLKNYFKFAILAYLLIYISFLIIVNF